MKLAIDFDGTLHMGKFPSIGAPAPYALEMMNKLRADGHYLIINTCRSGDQLLDAINWLLARGFPFDRVNDNHPDEIARYGNNSRKIHAHYYVDDKQIGELPVWTEIYQWITQRQEQYTRTASDV